MFTFKKTKKVLNNIKKFNKKKFNYNKYVKEFYVEKGIAHVYANVTSYDDIISRYSVKNYEVLNDDFINYLEQVTYYIPIVYPVVLSIDGCKFSLEEEKIIEEKVKEYFGLKLSDATMNLKENRRKSLILLLVSFLTWSLLSLFNYFNIAEIFMEAYLVIIWFFLWTFAEFEFIDRPKLKYDKLDMAQLASMKIVFKHE